MAEIRVNPTRMELKKLQTRLLTSRRGHKLLKDKRDELMRQFLDLMRENKILRASVEERLRDINNHFAEASAVMSSKALDASLLVPKQQLSLEVSTRNVMSVDIPQFQAEAIRSDGGDLYPYGFAYTSFELDGAVTALDELTADLVRLAQMEKSTELMSAEIEKTRRRVNALEHVLIPRYQETIKFISMKLEENERGSRTRLMKVKDMMLDKAHNYSGV